MSISENPMKRAAPNPTKIKNRCPNKSGRYFWVRKEEKVAVFHQKNIQSLQIVDKVVILWKN
jgi:hypothetical protein